MLASGRCLPVRGLRGMAFGSLLLAGVLATPLASQTALELTTDDGVTVFGEVHGELASARALLVLFHQGGANAAAEYGPLLPRLLDNGYAAITVDQRSGGSMLGGQNRTAQALEREIHYCDAYPDVLATVEHARSIAGDLPIVAWGSSYSGALVMRLGGEQSDLAGVLAFSPAGGEAMGACPASRFASDVAVRTLVLRPESEFEIDYVGADWDAWGELGFELHVARPGRHGSSMLNPNRVEGDVEPTWTVVLEFLEQITS